ncbi:hypothetical protein C8F04DRAFT_1268024 [Mycena alexandri]|uniref:DUF6533 domain-containing protein n=1 Tax=Mycena alexandri TaxID=1745969 RepID=A0AAD6SGP5_9AGAR|nr:hypothetical protein C8F04DRAFT_1268024 [Mycena alexandri]
MAYNPNYLQGSAMAALTWVVYDVCLTLDREIVSVWRSSWSLSKVLFLFSRYHTILSLGFFLMECIGTKHFLLFLPANVNGKPLPPSFFAPCIANLPFLLICSIVMRLAVYGWSRKIVAVTLFLFCAETVIGLGTTVISLLGGSKGLFGSTNILTCEPDRANVPDVNVASVYVGLVIHKALNVLQDIEAADGRPKAHKVSLITYFKASRVTLPIFHLSVYFVVVFMVLLVNLLLVVSHNRFAQVGSAWLLATYSVASTRIFLNLKELTLSAHKYNGATWSEFQQNSALELQVRSVLRTRTSHDRQPMHEPHQPEF